MTNRINLALIDDDEAILDALDTYLRRHGLALTAFTTAPAFLKAIDGGAEFDCIVSDIRMPGMSGLELQDALRERGYSQPLVFITGHGDVEMAVRAVKAGAADFIEKPTDDVRLLASVTSAVAKWREIRQDEAELAAISKRYEQLSERQREVMDLAIRGISNKEIAAELGISPRTVEHYREWVMERMQAASFAELVHMAARLKLGGRKGNAQ